jgi:asparagine synthase (glutamine-hydrolysing)
LAAYDKWGEDCVEHFLGDFAFAIWDPRSRKLFCARDHMGVKPFYYAFMPGRLFVFATEIKAVLSVPGIAHTVNERCVADAYVHLINDPASTYYSQVSRLPAAHSLTLTRALSMRRYWRLNPERELRLNSDQEYAEGFRNLFSQAVRCRMRSSHPIGSMLSGGLDSSAVSCVARDWLKAQGKPKLHTFSAVFDEISQCDERPYIQTVLDQGHCESNFMVLDRVSPLSDAASVIWHLDEPFWAANLYLNWNAYRRAEEVGVRVVLDGFDGDTTVSHGYGRLGELAASRRWWELATELRSGSKNLGVDSWLDCWFNWFCKFHPAAHRARRTWRGAKRRLNRLGSSKTPALDRIDVLNPDLARRLGLQEIAQKPAARYKNERDRHFQWLEREIMTKLVELLDHTSAAFNVEVRLPFMDVRLIEYCLSLPSDQKLRGGLTRRVMRNGLAGVLPDKIQQRNGKSLLGASFENGLLKFERDNLEKIILHEADRLAVFVNLDRVKECLARFRRGALNEIDATVIFTTANLAQWLRSRHTEAKPFMLQRKEVKNE